MRSNMCYTEQNLNQHSLDSDGVQDRVSLTDHHYWHINKRPIPRYDKEDLSSTPFSSPDMLDFAVEED